MTTAEDEAAWSSGCSGPVEIRRGREPPAVPGRPRGTPLGPLLARVDQPVPAEHLAGVPWGGDADPRSTTGPHRQVRWLSAALGEDRRRTRRTRRAAPVWSTGRPPAATGRAPTPHHGSPGARPRRSTPALDPGARGRRPSGGAAQRGAEGEATGAAGARPGSRGTCRVTSPVS